MSSSADSNDVQPLSSIDFQPSVENIDDGYALCDKDTLSLVYSNSTFTKWFDIDALHIPIADALPSLKTDILLKRLSKRGIYLYVLELDEKKWGFPQRIEVSFKLMGVGDEQYIAMHARDMTKLLEKDALLSGHSRMIEKSNRELDRLSKQLQTENTRLSAEVDVARKLQQFLLPSNKELMKIKDLDVACFMDPADEVGGDYYDVLLHDDGVRVGIGDITGHGLESGVVMLMVQVGVRTLLASKETDATRILSTLNQVILDNVIRMESDKSLSLAILDFKDGDVRVTGQHEEIIVVRKDGSIECIDTMDLGFPIGLDTDIDSFIHEIHLQLEPGDGIVLYTDGITEAENKASEQYEMQRLCAVIKKHWPESTMSIGNAILNDLYQFIGGHNVYDDITLLVIKQK